MARDDWRVRVELEDAHTFLDRIGLDISAEAKDLARELAERRLPVSRDDDSVFVYASTGREAEQARKVVEAELGELGLKPLVLRVEHWLTDDDRWDDEPEAPDVEEELAARGYAPWEVRVECASHDEADRASRLARDRGLRDRAALDLPRRRRRDARGGGGARSPRPRRGRGRRRARLGGHAPKSLRRLRRTWRLATADQTSRRLWGSTDTAFATRLFGPGATGAILEDLPGVAAGAVLLVELTGERHRVGDPLRIAV